MATQTIRIVEGNTSPPYQLTAQRNGTIINLTGCTVNLVIWNGSAVTNVANQACVVTTPLSGLVTYTAGVNDFTTATSYICDLVVTYSDATVETLYDNVRFVARRKVNSTS